VGLGIGGVLEQLIGPPGGLIFLALLGLALMSRHRRLGRSLAFTGFGLLYVASLPVTAMVLLSSLEPANALTAQDLAAADNSPQAIVVLGAGRRYAPELGQETVNGAALQRVRYAAWLAKRTGLPLLATGGLAHDSNPAEAVLMQQVLAREFAVPVRWVESESRTTYENAKFTAKILKSEGIDRVYLVTHALHMKRSLMSFAKFGLTAIPAPTAYEGRGWKIGVRSFLPRAEALFLVDQVFHEWVGMAWYWMRY
jgi:uncharacterized SAM-binding protein YcdF (DUF218 family)